MATEIELEKTFLAARLPEGIEDCRSEIIEDIYVPASVEHPILRMRRRGEKCEITKKEPVDGTDSTKQYEHTISLTPDEYAALAMATGKRFKKRRYYCQLGGHNAEVDVYLDALEGLVVIDFEFSDQASMDAFVAPDICLADVSQEASVAGGILAGKSYADVEQFLASYKYVRLTPPAGAIA